MKEGGGEEGGSCEGSVQIQLGGRSSGCRREGADSYSSRGEESISTVQVKALYAQLEWDHGPEWAGGRL